MSEEKLVLISKNDFLAVVNDDSNAKVFVREGTYSKGDMAVLCNEIDQSLAVRVVINDVIKTGLRNGTYIVVDKISEFVNYDVVIQAPKESKKQGFDFGAIIARTIGFFLALLIFIFVTGLDERILDEINSSTTSSVAIDFSGENLSIDTDYEYRRSWNDIFDNREDLVLNIDYDDHELELDLDWPDKTTSCDGFILNHISSIKMVKKNGNDGNTIVVDFDSILKRKTPKPDLIGCASDIVKISISKAELEQSIVDSYQ